MFTDTRSAECPQLLRQWEEAYLARAGDAAVGRLFKGVIHNLNGVLQVASFHADMSDLNLGQAAELLARAESAAPGDAAAPLARLAALLAEQRQDLVAFKEKIGQGSEILRRVAGLPTLYSEQNQAWNLHDILQSEIEFLCADSFFKHKVQRKLELDLELPALTGDAMAVHEVINLLLENAMEALRGREQPAVVITARARDGRVELVIRDNGSGVAAADRERIFAPFFTTREQHPGLGLYLARKLAGSLGGEIHCLEEPGGAFQLLLPILPAQMPAQMPERMPGQINPGQINNE